MVVDDVGITVGGSVLLIEGVGYSEGFSVLFEDGVVKPVLVIKFHLSPITYQL